MFSYLENVWHESAKQTATIDSLLQLCKDGEVKRVIIPHTYYGYGATLIDDSNHRSIQRHYKKSRFTKEHYSLTMSASQFVRNSHYREFIQELAEQDPLFDEQDYSNLEHETKLEFIVDEIESELDRAGLFIAGKASSYWTKHYVEMLLTDSGAHEEIEWWEFVVIDVDGATPYAEKTDITRLALEVQALSVKLWGKDTK